jgi:RHS repeat-associated protein
MRLCTGGEWDAETSLYYYRARYYSPSLGQFTSEDPAGDSTSSRYVYAAGNPILNTDPTGWFPYTTKYPNVDIAAVGAILEINPVSIREDREYAGIIFCNGDGSYSYTPARPGTRFGSSFHWEDMPIADRDHLAGVFHTHGAARWFGRWRGDEDFSDADKGVASAFGIPSYLGTPRGAVKKCDPSGHVTTLIPGK